MERFYNMNIIIDWRNVADITKYNLLIKNLVIIKFLIVWICTALSAKDHEATYLFLYVTIGSCVNSVMGPFILSALGSRSMMIVSALGTASCWALTSLVDNLLLAQDAGLYFTLLT